MSNAMSFSRRLTLPKAIDLNVLSPLMSMRAAMVENRPASSWLSDMVGRIVWAGGRCGITATDVESAVDDPVRRVAAVLRWGRPGVREAVQQRRGAVGHAVRRRAAAGPGAGRVRAQGEMVAVAAPAAGGAHRPRRRAPGPTRLALGGAR